MRKLLQPGTARGRLFASTSRPLIPTASLRSVSSTVQLLARRSLAKVRDTNTINREAAWFSSSSPGAGSLGEKDHRPVDERTLKLGKTVRILHERLPSLLATPLPQEILSPQITLRLFPSTHPHLPSVTGRIAYTAALWTSPVAWGRMPVLGNVKLVILSERMARTGGSNSPFSSQHDNDGSSSSDNSEKLIVRWKTCVKQKGDVTDQIQKMMAILGRDKNGHEHEFHGLFLFEFDEQGRIASHTIEHVEESNNWEKTARVISVTDWLLGRVGGKKEEPVPGLALCEASGNERCRMRLKER